ncbi:MAG TPA: hypothetical protein VGN86_04115 [Pyrinomonadaceae bacterium]|jgi:hypothetical protein|nr:hypothetical protein [Pyrinomonadaceae bacterium]
MKRIALLFLLAMLSIRMHGQQIGEIDLGRHQLDTAELLTRRNIPAVKAPQLPRISTELA